MLYLRDKPVAFWHGNAYRGSFGVISTGFDPAYAEDRPGTYLLMRAVEDLSADGSAQVIDFGFGDADYKRHFGDGFVEEQDVGIFERRPRTIALNAAHSALGGATAAGRAVAGSTGALATSAGAGASASTPASSGASCSALLMSLSIATAAGLAAGPATAMGPGKTVSSELFVDGVRRPDRSQASAAPRASSRGPRRRPGGPRRRPVTDLEPRSLDVEKTRGVAFVLVAARLAKTVLRCHVR